jgi:hypothetical protein
MVGTMNSIAIGEKMNNHKFIMGTADSKAKWHNVAKDTDYNFAPKLDQDMVITAKNLADSQTNLGHKWVIDDLQIGSQMNTVSDPICSSAGCEKSDYTKAEEAKIVQYPDPNAQGYDHDVKVTLKNEGDASDRVGHVWNP